MPTIQELPPAQTVGAADELPLSQGGTLCSVAVGELLAGTQPAIMAPTGSLLGRLSLGPGGPEPVSVGMGLAIQTGTLAATGTDHANFPLEVSPSANDQLVMTTTNGSRLLPLSTLQGWLGTSSSQPANFANLPVSSTIAAADLVAINQNGTNAAISYANLLNGETIDEAGPAAAASDSDSFWVAQGSSTMVRQSFGAVWTWAAGKLPTYKSPILELSSNTTLDSTAHNGRVLVCSSPITLTPAFTTMGSGFSCTVLNLSGGQVTLGAGIMTSTSQGTLSPGQAAILFAVTFSLGNIVYAAILGGLSQTAQAASTAITALPGQVTGLAASNIQATSLQLSWSSPASGGEPTSYTIQYSGSGSALWATYASGVTSTALAINGLSVSTSYNFQVFAVNSAGAGVPSTALNATTATAAKSISSITWNLAPNAQYPTGTGAIGVNVHVSPSSSAVQFGLSSSSTVPPTSWTAGTYVNTDLWGAYIAVPSQSGNYYVWCEGLDGSLSTVYPAAISVS